MRNVCGLDVHKDNIFVRILKENSVKIQFRCGILTKELDDVTTQHPHGMSSYDGMIMIAFLHPDSSAPVMAKPFFLIIYRKDLLLFLESCIFASENN